MPNSFEAASTQAYFLSKDHWPDMIRNLLAEGYRVIAPVEREGVIALRPVENADQIAHGLRDLQAPGHYRLEGHADGAIFRYTNGADSPKRYFFPPEQKLFSLRVKGEQFVLDHVAEQPPKLAFIGVRPCDLAAIAVQDRVFGIASDQQTFRCESESYYRQAREQAFMVAVNCSYPGGNCFCDAMKTGPVASGGYDLAMSELHAGFIVRAGSEPGRAMLTRLTLRSPTEAELELEQLRQERAREHMGRKFNAQGVRELLGRSIDHPNWNQIAKRCLGCGNCTMVCPTCFCSTVSDSNDPATGAVSRTRNWESCFTHQFSYTTAGPVRNSIRGRYRHWMRHKLSTWWDQFGTSGCVGCGRCITWCPVGIDITAEVENIRRGFQPAADNALESEATI